MERKHQNDNHLTLTEILEKLSKPRFLRLGRRLSQNILPNEAINSAAGGEVAQTASLLLLTQKLDNQKKMEVLLQAYDALAANYEAQAHHYEETGLSYVADGWRAEGRKIRLQKERLKNLRGSSTD